MTPYLKALRDVRVFGHEKEDRTGTGTYSIFGGQVCYDLREGFPLLTTKKMFTKGIVHELLWFLKGDTNIKYLLDNNVHIWDEWADENGDLGPVYGKQWRSWQCADGRVVDQIKKVVQQLHANPDSRRLIVSAWNPADVDDMALPPCHCLFQFYSVNGYLDLQLYQRSADMFLGVPFNIASYALLLSMVAHVTGLIPRYFIHTLGDSHIYKNHIEQVDEQLSRKPLPLPKLVLDKRIEKLDDFSFKHIKIEGYESHPAIKGEVSV